MGPEQGGYQPDDENIQGTESEQQLTPAARGETWLDKQIAENDRTREVIFKRLDEENSQDPSFVSRFGRTYNTTGSAMLINFLPGAVLKSLRFLRDQWQK